jgi:DNA-binding CsgD family transcriptional regulator
LSTNRRRELHARAVALVDEAAAWVHRVAALDRPDEDLAGELERLAVGEAARGHLSTAATHLLWASDISPARADRERRLLTAALHLMLADEARGIELRAAAEATTPGPLRSCVLGTMEFTTGQLGTAEQRFSEALVEAQLDPDSGPLAAMVANRLAGTYGLLGEGKKMAAHAEWALRTGCLDPAAESQTRTLLAIGASHQGRPSDGLARLGHIDPEPRKVDLVHVDGLTYRGVFHLLDGDLPSAVDDLAASIRMARRGATITLGLRAYVYLGLAQYLAGSWDDVLLTSEQAFSAAAIHARRYELPMLHLVASCVPAGRGAAHDAERHATLAEEAAVELDYGQERLYAAMARALLCQASGDYGGMADALGPWTDEEALDNRTRTYGVLWRPLLVESLIGSGRYEEAGVALERLQAHGGRAGFLGPALAWLEGWLTERRGLPEAAAEVYRQGEQSASTDSPVYVARMLLAYGRFLRRSGQRRAAIERLRRAHELYVALRATPFVAQAEAELLACGLPAVTADRSSALSLTDRETEVAHLIGRGMANAEIAAELFITQNTVEYHLRNIYAKFGVKRRQELRRALGELRRPDGQTSSVAEGPSAIRG